MSDLPDRHPYRHPYRHRQPTPLDVLDAAFRRLLAGPTPLALDGTVLGHGFPARPIPLDELKTILLHPSCSYAARDAAWAELLRLARGPEPAWMLGAAGVAMPGLRRAAGRLGRDYPGGDGTDCDAEVVAGFLQALVSLDPAGGRVAARLCWAAYRSGHRARRADLLEGRWRDPSHPAVAEMAARPAGHPDLALAGAVAAGVISAADARLIGVTRLEKVPIAYVAGRVGVAVPTLRRRRQRAEKVLAVWLTTTDSAR